MSARRWPAEWEPHERTLMHWPARAALWGEAMERAKADHARIADAIVAFEPVTVAAHPAQVAEARAALPAAVEVVAVPIDDSWVRDSGPITVLDDGRRVGIDFAFNAWGEKFPPWDQDAASARALLEHLGIAREPSPIVLEGGSVATDGAGTLLTTEQCLLEPKRNPGRSRDELEAELKARLGAERVVWLRDGLVEDRDTDGHVDNVAAFVPDGRVVLQAPPAGDPNHEPQQENAERLRAAGLGVVELPWLPEVPGAAERTVVPYVNYLVVNGGVVVPVRGAPSDEEALALLAELHPGREVVGVPGETLAHPGGGGVHCITMQVPAAPA